MGSALGGRAATAGANVGQSLLTGGINAARTQQQANAYNPFATALSGLAQNQQFGEGVSEWWKNLGTSGSTQGAAGYNIPQGAFENYYRPNAPATIG